MTEEEMEQYHQFGLRLSTAAQIMQGLLATGKHKLCKATVDSSVEWADKLIERCRLQPDKSQND